MITLIIFTVLTVLTGVGIYFLTRGWDYEILGFIFTIIFGLWLIAHTICILTVSYDYEMFVVKRDAFEKTLNDSRKNGNDYETAAIVKEVATWNISLAEKKYYNNTLFFDIYVDDRIELLEPIK